LDDAYPELLSLLLLVHGDILNVAHAAQSAQELALDKQRASAYDSVRRLVDYNERVVRLRGRAHRIELGDPRRFTEIGRDSENRKDCEMPSTMVCGREWSNLREKIKRRERENDVERT
jgi:hypothetical protein